MNIGNCSICLSGFTAEEMGMLRECLHTFHQDCILCAVDVRGECPLCRHVATEQDVKRPVIESPVPDGNIARHVSDT